MFLSLCETVPNGSMHGPVVVTSPTWAAGPAGSSSGWHAESLPQASSIDQQHCNSRGKDRRRSPTRSMEPGRRRGSAWSGWHVATAPVACAPKRRADRSAAGRREALARRSGSTGTLPRARALLALLRLLCAPRAPIPSASHSIMRRRRPRPAPWPAGRACRAMWFLAVFTHRTPTPALRPREEKVTRLPWRMHAPRSHIFLAPRH